MISFFQWKACIYNFQIVHLPTLSFYRKKLRMGNFSNENLTSNSTLNIFGKLLSALAVSTREVSHSEYCFHEKCPFKTMSILKMH